MKCKKKKYLQYILYNFDTKNTGHLSVSQRFKLIHIKLQM